MIGLPWPVLAATGGIGGGLLTVLLALLLPGRTQLPWRRRRGPWGGPERGLLSQLADGMTALIERLLRQRNGLVGGTAVLEQAGVKMRLQEFSALVIISTVVAAAVGLLVGGILLALVLVIMVPVGIKLWLGMKTRRRQRSFADQLQDSLQLLASSLRAGHSMLQALNSVARESESPTSDEFARIINQTRVGREVGEALEETALRMDSDDFAWVVQAIAINREVGGNLAEVLDAVGATIRERNQIRRQVKALAAEGKISAYVLMALPIGICLFLGTTNPTFIQQFTTSGVIGYGMIVTAFLLLIAGALWLRKTIQIKF